MNESNALIADSYTRSPLATFLSVHLAMQRVFGLSSRQANSTRNRPTFQGRAESYHRTTKSQPDITIETSAKVDEICLNGLAVAENLLKRRLKRCLA
jgi:hypothetical protein